MSGLPEYSPDGTLEDDALALAALLEAICDLCSASQTDQRIAPMLHRARELANHLARDLQVADPEGSAS